GMRLTRSSFLSFLATLPVAYEALPYGDPLEAQHYRIDTYIRAAVALQSIDRATAIKRLHEMAQDPRLSITVTIICRMLFTGRHGSFYTFRAPYIGVPSFVRGTEADWPRWPIELVDGVPFMIVWGYTLAGLPESDESYLRYCEANCDWTGLKYTLKTDEQ